jgi:hypothetical protein
MKICLAALGLALVCGGCAAAVEDPQPEEAVLPTEQRDPPRQLFYGELYDPVANIAVDLDEIKPDLQVPPRQTHDRVWPR